MKHETLEMNSGKRAVVWLDLGLILFCWGLFLLLLHYVWPYMGINVTEELNGAAAYAWIHQIQNMMMVPHIRLFGKTVPAMLLVYQGPWEIYSLAPFIALGGCTLATLRVYAAFMFLLALWGTWRLTMLLGNDRTLAFLAAFLLAVCPTLATACSGEVLMLDMAASVWVLCFAVSFARTRKPLYAYAACAAFFIGLGTRTWVAGLGVGLLLYIILTWRRVLDLLPESPSAKARFIAGCLGCAAAALLPIIAYNMSHGWPTIEFFASHLVERQGICAVLPNQTCSNLNYWTNLKTSFAQLAMLCDGDELTVLLREPWHWLYTLPMVLSFFYAARDAWRRRTLWSVPAMLWITAIGYLLASPISPTDEISFHLIPLAPILCALMFSWVNHIPAGALRKSAVLASALLCLAQFTGDFHLLRPDNIDLEKAGYYTNSPLVIDVCRWAQERPRTPIVPLSWPLYQALPYFSQNQARVIPPLAVLTASAKSRAALMALRRLLRRSDKPLFAMENDSAGTGIAAALKLEARALGLRPKRIKVFLDESNRPAFEIYRFQ